MNLLLQLVHESSIRDTSENFFQNSVKQLAKLYYQQK